VNVWGVTTDELEKAFRATGTRPSAQVRQVGRSLKFRLLANTCPKALGKNGRTLARPCFWHFAYFVAYLFENTKCYRIKSAIVDWRTGKACAQSLPSMIDAKASAAVNKDVIEYVKRFCAKYGVKFE